MTTEFPEPTTLAPPLPAIRMLEAHLANLARAHEQIERARQIDAWLDTAGRHELECWWGLQPTVRDAFRFVDHFRAACDAKGLDATSYFRDRLRLVALSDQAVALQRELNSQAA